MRTIFGAANRPARALHGATELANGLPHVHERLVIGRA
jgi:hypothetical protein